MDTNHHTPTAETLLADLQATREADEHARFAALLTKAGT